jgi:hypothetical protein
LLELTLPPPNSHDWPFSMQVTLRTLTTATQLAPSPAG